MKLIIDLGNTSQKYYIYKRKELTEYFLKQDSKDSLSLKELISAHGPFSSAIISSVIDTEPAFINTLKQTCRVIIFNSETPIPIGNDYATPATLGSDRLAAAVAGYTLFPNHPVLVIDAGTCIKYDIVAEGNYKGGIIAPGILMQAKALHTFTDKLPLITPESGNEIPLTGVDTYGSLLSGIINTTIASMQGIINRYKELYPDLKIVLSGGDRNYFDKMLKNSIFAHPNIVAAGLNEILDFNEEIK